jgi:hypothetical protein
MARFRGTVQGGRGEASRLGHSTAGLVVLAQSYSGDVFVHLYDYQGQDQVRIRVGHHGESRVGKIIYDGPVESLLQQSTRKTMLTALASDMLIDAAA